MPAVEKMLRPCPEPKSTIYRWTLNSEHLFLHALARAPGLLRPLFTRRTISIMMPLYFETGGRDG
jgi:hypothetical protein